jgi:hypothetical protein
MLVNFKYIIALFLFLTFKQFLFADNDSIPIIKNIHTTVGIDGIMDAIWNDLEPNAITYMINGSHFPTQSDCSGYFKSYWNNDSLFLLVYAIDDIIGTGSANPWENDGFEIYFDMDNSKDSVYKEDNYQFRFNLNSSAITGTNGNINYTPPTVNFAIKSYPEHYNILEVVFPVVELGMPTEIHDKYLGFDVQILDNDGSGREAAMAWNNNEHQAYLNPGKMGTIFISSEIMSSVNNNSIASAIYPNPASDRLFIKSETGICKIKMISADGKLCIEKDLNNITNPVLDINQLISGLYLIEITYTSLKKDLIKVIKK